MKCRILFTAAALMLCFGAFAQWGEQDMQLTPDQRATRVKERIDKMDTVVKLSPQERGEVARIFNDNYEKTREVFSSGDMDNRMDKVTKLSEEQDKKLKDLLGEERFNKYTAACVQEGTGRMTREMRPVEMPREVYPATPPTPVIPETPPTPEIPATPPTPNPNITDPVYPGNPINPTEPGL